MTVWNAQQRRLLVALNAGGGLVLAWSWLRSRDTSELADQVTWLNLGIAALLVATGGDVLWLLAGRRAIIGARRRCLGDVELPHPRRSIGPAQTPPEPVASIAGWAPAHTGEIQQQRVQAGRMEERESWLHVPGTTRVHTPGCSLVTDKHTETVDAHSLRSDEGLKICEICGEG